MISCACIAEEVGSEVGYEGPKEHCALSKGLRGQPGFLMTVDDVGTNW